MAGTDQIYIKWYACDEHVEVVLDQLVDEVEIAPDLNPCEPDEAKTATCHWCGGTPAYRLSAHPSNP
ncbi:CxxH/CxxC protein, BA_5709 family [Marininema mesophilum]|uniref:CxxH/CxxC protein, BA_5709 family n=1 Tax=Marininema mesophilum TaxID=1048340 RepID=A0A1H3AGK9_9BACL|nr:CxxH/CxxC protein [Marininema mesophilum]SDX28867.1 CxxH/CxxC protein, BA_5709 family [Marininema mesophilum]